MSRLRVVPSVRRGATDTTDLHPPCEFCSVRWFHGHAQDCPTRRVVSPLPDWFLALKPERVERSNLSEPAACPCGWRSCERSPRRWTSCTCLSCHKSVWCNDDEHERCRSHWGRFPCKCSCHGGAA
jgi:hypothetical protein